MVLNYFNSSSYRIFFYTLHIHTTTGSDKSKVLNKKKQSADFRNYHNGWSL